MKDFTPTEKVACIEWTVLTTTRFNRKVHNVPAIKANCTGKESNGADWFAELVRAENGQEWMRLNFGPIDQADYPKLYTHLEAGIKLFCQQALCAKKMWS